MALPIPVTCSEAHLRHAPETVVVQEGDYVLDTPGAPVLAALERPDETR